MCEQHPSEIYPAQGLKLGGMGVGGVDVEGCFGVTFGERVGVKV